MNRGKLVVIAGPANSGKMPLARKLLSEDPDLLLVHRDYIRDSLVNQLDEWHITHLMADIAERLLSIGRAVVVCAWNLEPIDREIFGRVARNCYASLEWLDVREPRVAAMIPPMKENDAPC